MNGLQLRRLLDCSVYIGLVSERVRCAHDGSALHWLDRHRMVQEALLLMILQLNVLVDDGGVGRVSSLIVQWRRREALGFQFFDEAALGKHILHPILRSQANRPTVIGPVEIRALLLGYLKVRIHVLLLLGGARDARLLCLLFDRLKPLFK